MDGVTRLQDQFDMFWFSAASPLHSTLFAWRTAQQMNGESSLQGVSRRGRVWRSARFASRRR